MSNALIAVNKQRSTREEQEKLVAAAEDATRLARIRYRGGATSYLEVLTTDSNLFTAQLNLTTAQQNEALTLVQLYEHWEGAGSNAGSIPNLLGNKASSLATVVFVQTLEAMGRFLTKTSLWLSRQNRIDYYGLIQLNIEVASEMLSFRDNS